MGQKVNPIGLRLGINRTWDSRWFSRKEYGNQLLDDLSLRRFLARRLTQAAVSRVLIERAAKKTRITLHSARPGVIIGKKGADIDKLRSDIAKVTNSEVSLNILEIRKPEIEAKLIAEGIAQQLERRVAFRRAMKRAVQSAMRFGAQGIRINCSGRLGGAEIARMEWYREGRVPSGAVDPDPLGAEPHRRLHRPLHRPAERDAALELLRDALGDQLGLDLRLPDLEDVEADLAVGDLGDVAAQFVDVGTLFADDDAGPRRMQRDPR